MQPQRQATSRARGTNVERRPGPPPTTFIHAGRPARTMIGYKGNPTDSDTPVRRSARRALSDYGRSRVVVAPTLEVEMTRPVPRAVRDRAAGGMFPGWAAWSKEGVGGLPRARRVWSGPLFGCGGIR